MATTALTRSEAEVTTQRGQLTKEVLTMELEQRALLKEFVRDCMTKGEDYGVIPGTPKPTLLKPGAEKLVDLFRCTPSFTLVRCTEDYERGFFAYLFRCRIRSREGTAVLAEGFGSANSKEGRYRWRDGKRRCPACGSAEAFRRSKKDGDGYFCWAKVGGCGKTYPEKHPEVVGQQVGKVENDDIATLANTILKMAKKRALVDASIALARCSDLFTQDVEDLGDDGHRDNQPPPPHVPSAPAPGDPEYWPPTEMSPPSGSGRQRSPAAKESPRPLDPPSPEAVQTWLEPQIRALETATWDGEPGSLASLRADWQAVRKGWTQLPEGEVRTETEARLKRLREHLEGLGVLEPRPTPPQPPSSSPSISTASPSSAG